MAKLLRGKGWKAVLPDGRAIVVYFNYTPYLPRLDRPGKWTPYRKRARLCSTGWHFCQTFWGALFFGQRYNWRPRIFRIEYKCTQRIKDLSKVVVNGQIRLLYEVNPKTGRRIKRRSRR